MISKSILIGSIIFHLSTSASIAQAGEVFVNINDITVEKHNGVYRDNSQYFNGVRSNLRQVYGSGTPLNRSHRSESYFLNDCRISSSQRIRQNSQDSLQHRSQIYTEQTCY